MRAIDIDELWRRIHATNMKEAVPDYWDLPYDDQRAFREQGRIIGEIIKSVPVVDAEPVVLCKDCKYAVLYEDAEIPYCDNEDGICGWVTEYDFCSQGKRAAVDGGAESENHT